MEEFAFARKFAGVRDERATGAERGGFTVNRWMLKKKMGAHLRLKLGTSFERSRRGSVAGGTRCKAFFTGPVFHGRIT